MHIAYECCVGKYKWLLENAGEKFEYVAVPELHKNGEHFHRG
jgi:hypothetical protein